MSRDSRVFLEDILTACLRIRGYVGPDPAAAWDLKTFDAVVRNLLIHRYFTVDESIVKDAVRLKLQGLEEAAHRLMTK
jgi:uncharacterized protein with HEPN domain